MKSYIGVTHRRLPNIIISFITSKLLSIGNIIRRTNVWCTDICKVLEINIEHIVVRTVFVMVKIRVFLFSLFEEELMG